MAVWIAGSGLSVSQLRALEEEDLNAWAAAGMPTRPMKVNWKYWWGDRYSICVALDENGSVIAHFLLEMTAP